MFITESFGSGLRFDVRNTYLGNMTPFFPHKIWKSGVPKH